MKHKPEELYHTLNRKDVLISLALIILVFITFFPALKAQYIWDDNDVLIENDLLKSVAGLWNIWTKPSVIPQGHYWPVLYTNFWLEYQLFGNNPFGYHLINILMHGVCCIFLYLLLKRLKIPGAWFAAALFAVHPLNVESVAWITERKNTLSGIFFFSSLLAYFYSDQKKWIYISSILLFLAALLTKTSVVGFPFVILLIIWWKRGRIRVEDIYRLIPFFAAAITIGFFDAILIKTGMGYSYGLTIIDRILIAGRAIWFYIYKLLFPFNLMAHYPRWQINPYNPLQYAFPLSLVIMIWLLWRYRNKIGRLPLVCLLYFIIMLAPTLGFVDFGYMGFSFVADRFQYLAGAGLMVLISSLLFSHFQKKLKFPAIRFAAAFLIMILSIYSFQYSRVFYNMETLFQHTLSKNPESWVAYNNLAYTHEERGDLETASKYYRKAMEIKPDDPGVEVNLANLLEKKGSEEKTLEIYNKILSKNPGFINARFNLANLLAGKGKIDQAIMHYRIALSQRPRDAEILSNLANALYVKGRRNEALSHYKKALMLNPELHEASYNAGLIYMENREWDEAIEYLERYADKNPDNPHAWKKLGDAFLSSHSDQKAEKSYRRSLGLNPDFGLAANNLAWLLATSDDADVKNPKEAIYFAEKACETSSGNKAQMYDTLATAYAANGQYPEAIRSLEKGIKAAQDSGDEVKASKLKEKMKRFKSHLSVSE